MTNIIQIMYNRINNSLYRKTTNNIINISQYYKVIGISYSFSS